MLHDERHEGEKEGKRRRGPMVWVAVELQAAALVWEGAPALQVSEVVLTLQRRLTLSQSLKGKGLEEGEK